MTGISWGSTGVERPCCCCCCCCIHISPNCMQGGSLCYLQRLSATENKWLHLKVSSTVSLEFVFCKVSLLNLMTYFVKATWRGPTLKRVAFWMFKGKTIQCVHPTTTTLFQHHKSDASQQCAHTTPIWLYWVNTIVYLSEVRLNFQKEGLKD